MRKLVGGKLALLALMTSIGSACAEPVCNVDSKIGAQLNLPVYEWVDDSVERKGIIVAVHGLTFYAASYDKMARYLASRGYAVYAADLRGFGRWKSEHQKFGGDDQIHFTQSKNDLLRIVNQLRADNPDAQIICLGESLGANYALWALSEEEGRVFDGAVLFAPGVKTRIHPHPRMAIDFFRGLRHPNKPLNLEPYITPYLSNDKAVTRTCLEDKRICRQLSPVELIKAHITNRRAIENVDKIPEDKPIMIVGGQKDQVFKTSALPAFAKRIGSKQVSVQTLPNKGHLMLEAQEVDADVRDAVDIWLATELQPTAAPPSVISGVNTARFSARIPTWLQTSIQRYSPVAMARASLQHAREWTTRLTSQ